jgi:DNA-binding PadR family transcriptional regulator
LKGIDASIPLLERQLQAIEKTGDLGAIEAVQRRLAAARERRQQALQTIEANAQAEAGNLLNRGTAASTPQGRQALAQALAQAGLPDVAGRVQAAPREQFDAANRAIQQDIIDAGNDAADRAAKEQERKDREAAAAEKRQLDAEEADRKAAADIRDAANADAAKKDAAAFGDQTDAAMAARKLRDQQVAELAANPLLPIEELATQYAAQARAKGGDFDPRTGRRTGQDPFVALSRDASAMVRQANPNLSPDQARDVGVQIAGQAFSQVDQAIQAVQQGAALSGQAVNSAGSNQRVLAMLAGVVQAQTARLNQIEQENAAMGMMLQDEAQRNAPRMRGQMRLRR